MRRTTLVPTSLRVSAMCRLYELLDRAESNASRAELCSADRLVSRADATLRDDGCAVEARALRELRLVAPSPLRLVRLPDTLDTARERGVAAGRGNGDCGSDAMTFFSALATACPKRWARDAMAGAETAGRSSDAGEQRRSGVGVAAGRGDGRPREPYCFPRLLQQPGARGELVRLHDAHQHAGEDPTDGEVCDLSEQSHRLLLHVSTSAGGDLDPHSHRGQPSAHSLGHHDTVWRQQRTTRASEIEGVARSQATPLAQHAAH